MMNVAPFHCVECEDEEKKRGENFKKTKKTVRVDRRHLQVSFELLVLY